ncbi:class III extradiol dioxygenase subunit B-like domain-containing protein [Kribbella sp. NPDC004536]|uniref:class III extradiol dioxygenase subunit B-like domain-containing protein n=1 Tax=Kribbella sp. NPDC004536 TaxID=3364106 RepID=UPI00369DC263
MPVTAAAVCPHPPLLIPELATGATPDLDDLRTACLTAIDHLSNTTHIIVIGSGIEGAYDAEAGGGFGAYGAPQVRIGAGAEVLPLSLAVGGWLLEQTKAAGVPRTYRAVAVDAAPGDCVELGREIAGGNERVGLLVMGDGSPRRSEHSPVHLHPRAEIFDTTVANAFQHKDLDVLKALDPALATELKAAGRAPWQVLAGALEGTALNGDLTYEAAPYGVGYFVASFT